MIALISHTSKVMLKILQAKLQQYVNRELPDVQAGFRKGRGTRDQIASICWIIEKAREFQKNIYFCFIDYVKAFDCVDHIVQFSHSVVSDSLQPHESQHTRPPCSSPTPRVHSDSTSIKSVMSSSHLILCRPLFLLPPIPPSIKVFSNELTLGMRWPKYWSFSFSIIPSKEYPGLISFRMDWLGLSRGLSRDSQESSPALQLKNINSLALSFLHSPTLTSILDHWKNHSLD